MSAAGDNGTTDAAQQNEEEAAHRNEDIESLTVRANRTITVIQVVEGVLLALMLAVILVLAAKVLKDESKSGSSCHFFRDLSTAPLVPSSSALGVQIITDSRTEFTGNGCPGKLPPPSPELLRLAAKYHIKVEA